MSVALYIKCITRVIDACLSDFGDDSATREGFQNAPCSGLAKVWKMENTTTIWPLHTLSWKENGIICAHLGTTPSPVSCWKGKPVKGQVYPSRLKIFKSTGQCAPCGHQVNPLTNFFKAACSLLITALTKSSWIVCKRWRSGVGCVDTWGVFLPPGFRATPELSERQTNTWWLTGNKKVVQVLRCEINNWFQLKRLYLTITQQCKNLLRPLLRLKVGSQANDWPNYRKMISLANEGYERKLPKSCRYETFSNSWRNSMATLSEAKENVTMLWINLEASTLKVEVWVCSRETMPKENFEVLVRSHSERRYGAAEFAIVVCQRQIGKMVDQSVLGCLHKHNIISGLWKGKTSGKNESLPVGSSTWKKITKSTRTW